MIKQLQDYISESESWVDQPRVGDDFAINIREECLVESHVVAEVEDGIVLAADDRMISILENYGMLEQDMAEESFGNRLFIDHQGEWEEKISGVWPRAQIEYSGEDMYSARLSNGYLVGAFKIDQGGWIEKPRKGVAEGKISEKRAQESAAKLVKDMGHKKALDHALMMANLGRDPSWLAVIRHIEMMKKQGVAEGRFDSDHVPVSLGLTFDDLERLSESAGESYKKFHASLSKNLKFPQWTNTLELYGYYVRHLNESKKNKILKEDQLSDTEQSLFDEFTSRAMGSIDSAQVGDQVALLHLATLGIPGYKVVAKINGFLEPKEIVKILNQGSFQQLEFEDGSRYPEKDSGELFDMAQTWNMTKLFPSRETASKALMFYSLVGKKRSDQLELDISVDQDVKEDSNKLQGTPVVSLSDFDGRDFTKNKYGQRVPKKLKKDDPRVKFYKEPKDQDVKEDNKSLHRIQELAGIPPTAMPPVNEGGVKNWIDDLYYEFQERYDLPQDIDDDDYLKIVAKFLRDEDMDPDKIEDIGELFLDMKDREDRYDASGRPVPGGEYDAGGHYDLERDMDRHSLDIDEAEYRGRQVSLGKPFLTPDGPKKRSVYVKNPKGNVVKVSFGDKKLRIKKSNPKRRKSFRARHHCENPGPRHKARYWSCRFW